MKHQHTHPHKAFAQALAVLLLLAHFAAPQARAADGVAVVASGGERSATVRLPAGVVGQRYARHLVLGGTPPYTLAVEAARLDDLGLSLDATGLLSGVPTQPGRFVFTVSAQDARAGTPVRQRFVLQVLKARKAR